MSLDVINLWHQRARPNPTPEDFSVQLGVSLEEVCEMLETLTFTATDIPGESTQTVLMLRKLSDELKSGARAAAILDRRALLDALADQVVTAVGVGHCAGMNVPEACYRVNASNWTKYNKDGQPIFDANGKIAKGPDYVPVNLDGLW